MRSRRMRIIWAQERTGGARETLALSSRVPSRPARPFLRPYCSHTPATRATEQYFPVELFIDASNFEVGA